VLTAEDIRANAVRARAWRAQRKLLDFIPWLSPAYEAPVWLTPFLERVDLAIEHLVDPTKGKPQRCVVHAPPQHGKTDSILHAIARALKKKPELQLGYVTYGHTLARRKSRRARELSERAGVQLATTGLGDWQTVAGGGLLATAIRGAFTGFSKMGIIFIDDPYKNRIEAESPVVREANEDWLEDVADTRLWPTSSCFVFHTRWHPQDLAGYCIRQGWEYICLPALDKNDKALWEGGSWPAAKLKDKRKRRPYSFASIFQGAPRPRGATVFGPATVYSELPKVYTAGFGIDLSYSAKTSSDWSAVVKILHANGKYFVVDVRRRQVRAPVFRRLCRKLHRKELSAGWRWYTSTTEQGVADLFNSGPRPVPVVPILARGDKLTRAQSFAEAWNAGDVLVPKDAPWLEDFLDELEHFTGVGDEEDDQVDAAVAAFDEVAGGSAEVPERPLQGKRAGIAGLAL
jgi:predicted phage terminase large subunit-like protein